MYVFMAVLRRLCRKGFSPVVASGNYALVAPYERLIAVVCLVVDHEHKGPGASGAVAPRLSCGIFLDQGSNPCPLRW